MQQGCAASESLQVPFDRQKVSLPITGATCRLLGFHARSDIWPSASSSVFTRSAGAIAGTVGGAVPLARRGRRCAETRYRPADMSGPFLHTGDSTSLANDGLSLPNSQVQPWHNSPVSLFKDVGLTRSFDNRPLLRLETYRKISADEPPLVRYFRAHKIEDWAKNLEVLNAELRNHI